jgi:membrane protein required for colicin V production
MGVIDWIILVFLLAFTVNGFRVGFAAMLIQLGGFILAFILIGHYYPLLASQLMLKYAFSKPLASIISILLIIVLLVVILRFVTWGINRFLKAVYLSWMNRSFGALFGFANGLLCVIIFTVILDYMPKLSDPLKDGNRHRVYTAVEQLKEDLFSKLQLENRIKLIRMPKVLPPKDSKPLPE